MTTSQAQIDRIKSLEDFRSKAYADGFVNDVQMYSIGYGHQIRLTETSLRTKTITKADAEKLLRSDIAPLEIQINRDLRVNPTQNQFDALIDFGYNLGSGTLSKIISTWNTTHNTKTVTDQMLQYTKYHDKSGSLVHSDDLQSRREKEVAIFNSSLPPVSIKYAVMGVAGLLAAAYIFK